MADLRSLIEPSYQTIGGSRFSWGAEQGSYVDYGFGRIPIGDPGIGIRGRLAVGNNTTTTPAPPPPHFIFTFDTIGQTIYRGIGNGRYPLRIIWALGITESGDTSISNTQTFAAAICAPIDPDETGEIFSLSDGGDVVLEDGNIIAPLGWTASDAALLATSLAGIVVYPGDESQLPAPLIVADKGADKTNAFRGLRYIIVPDYPIRSSGNGGLPQLSAVYNRNNDPDTDSGAVEFSAGGD